MKISQKILLHRKFRVLKGFALDAKPLGPGASEQLGTA